MPTFLEPVCLRFPCDTFAARWHGTDDAKRPETGRATRHGNLPAVRRGLLVLVAMTTVLVRCSVAQEPGAPTGAATALPTTAPPTTALQDAAPPATVSQNAVPASHGNAAPQNPAVPSPLDQRTLSLLDASNPWYPNKDFPRLRTPQWVGDEGVECVVVLAIDDMRETAKYEQYLRPILNRLKQIDGRAPVSIMTCNVRPDDPQLQSWLDEGLSIECHTVDHPCPLLHDGDFDKAKSTYDRCIDLLARIPGNQPVAFRTPCCDSLNTVSPRFYSEIFPVPTPDGHVLRIDSSVMNFFTSDDESIPRELVLDKDGGERFWKYKVRNLKRGDTIHDDFVNYIVNYPYPYLINQTCWQFPCVAPSDWSAQHLHGINHPRTVADWKAALDITVHQQGVFNLVFHPHGWMTAEQIVELIDHAVIQHGTKVKFLNFREASDRLHAFVQAQVLLSSSPTEAMDTLSHRTYRQTHHGERDLGTLSDNQRNALIAAIDAGRIPNIQSLRKMHAVTDGPPSQATSPERPESPGPFALPTKDVASSGAFFDRNQICWINEHTADQPDLMQRVSMDEILAAHQPQPADNSQPTVAVGAAVIDITPEYPVRLTGYGNRLAESDGIAIRIHARALCIGEPEDSGAAAGRSAGDQAGNNVLSGSPSDSSDTAANAGRFALLMTVDNCGVPADVTEKVYDRIHSRYGIARERFSISSTHTHSGPWLRGFAPNIFAEIPDDHAARLAQYQQDLIEKLTQLADAAVAARKPGHLSLGFGKLGFAMNRRVLNNGQWTGFGESSDGPVDQRFALLAAHDPDGKLIAVLANYACHATTETGAFQQISGDWPGFAADMIEADLLAAGHENAIAMIAIGCGADANPSPRGTHQQAQQHGRAVAEEVRRLLAGSADTAQTMKRIDPRLTCRMIRVDLPLGPLPAREEWLSQSADPGVTGSRARYFLKLQDEGKPVPHSVPEYPVQTWCFGNDLAMVFLGGEVVVDYSIRLNEMLDGDRLWLNAYSNDVPCYIASKRILREGGYEADSSMVYYRQPTRLAPEAEDVICDAVQKLLPHEFYSASLQAEFPAPKPPRDSMACITVRPDLKVELVAAEPLIQDPVAFDWDVQGRLWVVEMGGYPERQSGRIRVLEDADGDGQYDKATTFLEELNFPTGITMWRNGVIISAAPDVIFAQDHDGDLVADQQTVLLTGFTEGNQQHRVNGLRWGLDGWLYLANGDSGGEITAVGTALQANSAHSRSGNTTGESQQPSHRQPTPSPVNIRGRDLRFHPDTGAVEALSGQTQFGRERDDFGNWFGNNNSNPIWHYLLEDRYLKRNPHARGLDAKAQVAEVPGAAPVFPTSATLARFNDFAAANRFTSACSTTIYRDHCLGEQFYGNAFTCEPVHNLISRLVLKRDGATFQGRRAEDERASEFFASSDNWTRPVMVRTGPDGALYVADMYRQVIEHPEWIPAEFQRKMDLYAGNDRGRIYRIVPANPCCQPHDSVSGNSTALRTENLRLPDDTVDTLLNQLESPNGWWRDTAQRLLLHRESEVIKDPHAVERLQNLCGSHADPAVQVQALHTAMSLVRDAEVVPNWFWQLLRNASERQSSWPEVRRAVIQQLEILAARQEDDVTQLLATFADEPDHAVRHQLILSLGELHNEQAAVVFSKLLRADFDQPALRNAAVTSLTPNNIGIVLREATNVAPDQLNEQLTGLLLGQAAAMGMTDQLTEPLTALVTAIEANSTTARFDAVRNVLDSIHGTAAGKSLNGIPEFQHAVDHAVAASLTMARDTMRDHQQRAAAIHFLNSAARMGSEPVPSFSEFFTPQNSLAVQLAAASAVAQRYDADSIAELFSHWNSFPPAVRGEVIATCLKRESTTLQVLQSMETGVLSVADFEPTQRDALQNHRSAQIRALANSLLGTTTTSPRSTVVADLKAQIANLHANASAGREVFEKRCSACHRLQDTGKDVGADLAALKDRSTDALLTAILDPNRAVESKFLVYTVVTNDGLQHTGMLKGETGGSLTLTGVDGKDISIARANIDELIASNRSLMPEGLEKDLSAQNLIDVIAFVQSTGVSWKRFDGNQPGVVAASADGTLTLPASAAEIFGPSLTFETTFGNLGWWSSQDDYAVWTVDVPRSGHWTVEVDYACENSAAGDVIKFSTGTRLLSARVPGTGSWNDYKTWTAGELDLHAGRRQIVVTSPQQPRSALIDLRTIRLIPPTNR